MRQVGYLLGTGLVILGALLLLSAGALYGYGFFERVRFEREQAAEAATAPPPEVVRATPTPEPTWSPTPAPTTTSVPQATPIPSPTATPTPVILPATRIVAPTIGLDSKIVESEVKNGLWQVPKFVAGHLQGTSDPGKPGNIVLAGHVESISSGNVFANIDQLKPGEWIRLYTAAQEFDYVIVEKKVVKNDDLSVVQPTPEETITLITCTGTWLPLRRDYDQRLIVVARRAPWTPPVKPTSPGPL